MIDIWFTYVLKRTGGLHQKVIIPSPGWKRGVSLAPER
jgi:hypothetical protein